MGSFMAWAKPEYTKSQVDRAGKAIAVDADIFKNDIHYSIINNWRSSHAYPLNTFQVTLRNKANSLSRNFSVSQRIKRLESIKRKLSSGTMQLSQMQDIAGCRAVVENIKIVNALYDKYSSYGDHSLRNEKNYILSPKDDGYRSLHLIFKYQGRDTRKDYDGLQIEIQIRSQDQHAWATAVEAVGTFTKQALKWRGGSAEWQRFFALMSSAIAIREDSAPVPGTPNSLTELRKEIAQLSNQLRVKDTLNAYNLTLQYVGNLSKSDAKILLVHMIPGENKVAVRGFRLRDSQIANQSYIDLEKTIPSDSSSQAVLVRVDSLQALQRAYPNYFLDTGRFSTILNEILRK